MQSWFFGEPEEALIMLWNPSRTNCRGERNVREVKREKR